MMIPTGSAWFGQVDWQLTQRFAACDPRRLVFHPILHLSLKKGASHQCCLIFTWIARTVAPWDRWCFLMFFTAVEDIILQWTDVGRILNTGIVSSSSRQLDPKKCNIVTTIPLLSTTTITSSTYTIQPNPSFSFQFCYTYVDPWFVEKTADVWPETSWNYLYLDSRFCRCVLRLQIRQLELPSWCIPTFLGEPFPDIPRSQARWRWQLASFSHGVWGSWGPSLWRLWPNRSQARRSLPWTMLDVMICWTFLLECLLWS